MVKLSDEEKKRETADWFNGLIVVAVVLIIAIVGYFAVSASKNKITYSNNRIETKKSS